METSVRSRNQLAIKVAVVGAVGVIAAGGTALLLVLLSITDFDNSAAAGYLPLAWSAAAVLVSVLLVGLFVRRVDVTVIPGFPWLIGLLSFTVSFLPWWGLAGGNPDLGTLIYRGLKVPQGIMQFWDLSLVMQSVDCARWGFDIYINNNGCMQDASIYAPGMVWLQYVPFGLFSQSNVAFLGVMMIVISSLVLVWLARQSRGLGQIVLAIGAIGGPWLLLMERGNIDAVVLWSAAVVVLLVRRWDALWVWILAALLLWLMGTWKYYPFVMGAMLLPVLRLRHGWTVIAGYLIAAVGFVLVTWENFRFSAGSNSSMVDFGDFVVLGRIPVVARMLGSEVGASGWQAGDLLLLFLTIAAVAWGIGVGLMVRRVRTWTAMLAVSGSALYLASVLVSGFGYGYKATFLLLAVPIISALVASGIRIIAASSLAALLLIAVQSVVVWNTVMVTLAGLIAAGFALGLGGATLLRSASRDKGLNSDLMLRNKPEWTQ